MERVDVVSHDMFLADWEPYPTLPDLFQRYRRPVDEWETSTEVSYERPEWFDQAACSTAGPDIFFPEKGEPTAPAKAICRNCPVRKQCLEYALDNFETVGVWGGFSERQRRNMRAIRNKRAGTPRTSKPAPHGTSAGYRRHWRAGEPPCDPCRMAQREACRVWKAKREAG